MSSFLNERSTMVQEAVDALVSRSGGALQRLDGYPDIKVVLRADRDRSKVAVVSGGGSGHEPAHAGFCGHGMLSAAVCGEVFASPSVQAVLEAIIASSGDAGCLLIVKNYTGDRLNFGLAAERARALGIAVETVLVSDDVAIDDAVRPRGIAGTLFVHKVAGFAAEAGRSLAEVKALAEQTARATVSLGLSLSSVALPGMPPSARLAEGEAELGLGIHGEPGREKIPVTRVDELAANVVQRLNRALEVRGVSPTAPLAVMVNNLGGVSALEMDVLTDAVLRSTLGPRIARLVGPAPLMTSLDMKGFSLSLLPLDDVRTEALDAPVAPRAWPGAVKPTPVTIRPRASAAEPTTFPPSDDETARRIVTVVAETLIGQERALDALDAKVGDGDTGTTFATLARAVLEARDRLPLAVPADLFTALGHIASRVMGGSSGVLLAIFTSAVGTALRRRRTLPEAMHEGVLRMQTYGGAKLGDRTMLDALIPAVSALQAGGGLGEAARAARAGADRTASILRAGAGRASYVTDDHLRGVPDPGAVAVAAVFDALEALAVGT